MIQVWRSSARIPSCSGKVSPCFVQTFNWLDEALHIMGSNLLSSKSTDWNVNFIRKQPSQKYPEYRFTEHLDTLAQPSRHIKLPITMGKYFDIPSRKKKKKDTERVSDLSKVAKQINCDEESQLQRSYPKGVGLTMRKMDLIHMPSRPEL